MPTFRARDKALENRLELQDYMLMSDDEEEQQFLICDIQELKAVTEKSLLISYAALHLHSKDDCCSERRDLPPEHRDVMTARRPS